MEKIQYIVREPSREIENPVLLLMLHGYGSNEEDLFTFANELPQELLIISARAPLSIGYGSYAWYNIYFNTEQSKFSDVSQAIQSRELIANFVDELKSKYHFDAEKSMIMGFSQGAILSYALAFSYPEKIKNILALSGYINPEMIAISSNTLTLQKLDFFCSHGSIDSVIPVEWARKSMEQLKQNAISYIYREYPAGHGIDYQNFIDLKEWIVEKINF
jgi:phospholipase/carboxylesterase